MDKIICSLTAQKNESHSVINASQFSFNFFKDLNLPLSGRKVDRVF